MDWQRLGPAAERLHRLIGEAVQQDTRKLYGNDAFARSIDELRQTPNGGADLAGRPAARWCLAAGDRGWVQGGRRGHRPAPAHRGGARQWRGRGHRPVRAGAAARPFTSVAMQKQADGSFAASTPGDAEGDKVATTSRPAPSRAAWRSRRPAAPAALPSAASASRPAVACRPIRACGLCCCRRASFPASSCTAIGNNRRGNADRDHLTSLV